MDRGHGSFPKAQFDAPAEYTVARWSPAGLQHFAMREQLVVSHIQPLGSTEVLLASARCWWRTHAADKNAAIYAWDGQCRARLTLGDGIQDLRTTPAQDIWVSYFDEGVFGNYGWGPPYPSPIGESGLCRFDRQGQRAFEFDAEAVGTDAICDAYALNVRDDDDVWVYFYNAFPIVHVAGARCRAWRCGLGGARGLAVNEPYVLLFGDYQQRSLARVVRLENDGSARLVREFTVELPSADAAAASAFGVGSQLYLFDGLQAFVLDDWWGTPNGTDLSLA